MKTLLALNSIISLSIVDCFWEVPLGAFASFIVWYITNICISPRFRIENIERDSNGTPYVKIRNSSKFDAYKVCIYVMYYDDKNTLYHTKLTKKTIIKRKQVYLLAVNIENTNVESSDINISIYVTAQNRFGVSTAKCSDQKLTQIIIEEHAT